MLHRRLGRVWVVAPAIVIGSSIVIAQKPGPASRPTITTTKASTAKEVDPEVAQRRSIALALLSSLAIEARSYRDEALRARVQARVAEALWDHEPDNARLLFRRAWEAEEAAETQNSGPSPAFGKMSNLPFRPRTNLRAEILKLAAQRDHALGEEFLKKLTAVKNDATPRAIESSNGVNALSAVEVRERLRLAGEFLRADDIQRALQFADPALNEVTAASISFLLSLHAKSAPTADSRFAALLARAAADPAADANTVSLLTTYVQAPTCLTIFALPKTGWKYIEACEILMSITEEHRCSRCSTQGIAESSQLKCSPRLNSRNAACRCTKYQGRS